MSFLRYLIPPLCVALMPAWFTGEATADTTSTNERLWAPIAEDLQMARLQLSSRRLFSTELTLFRTSLQRYRVGVVRATEFGSKRDNVRNLTQKAHAIAGINANFFDKQNNPLGLVISKGIIQQKIHWGGSTLSGIFYATRKNIAIAPRKTFNPDQVLEALQAGPRLISNSAREEGLHDSLAPSRRAGVCIDGAGRLILFAVSSRIVGLDIEELQEILLRKDINCVQALNFDGGGSAQIFVDSKLPGGHDNEEHFIQGKDPIPVILALFRRP